MTHEVPGQNGFREFKLILPTLQAPVEGDFEAVYMDYLSDPERFKVALQYRLSTDNPELATYFIDSPATVNPNLANKWLYIYYAMFERAAKRDGLPPLRVSSRVVDTYNRLGLLNAENCFETEAEEAFMDKIKADWKKRRERDRKFSPELVKFWNSVDEDVRQMHEEDPDYELYDIGDILPVISLQTLFQNQQDEFSLIERYEL